MSLPWLLGASGFARETESEAGRAKSSDDNLVLVAPLQAAPSPAWLRGFVRSSLLQTGGDDVQPWGRAVEDCGTELNLFSTDAPNLPQRRSANSRGTIEVERPPRRPMAGSCGPSPIWIRLHSVQAQVYLAKAARRFSRLMRTPRQHLQLRDLD